MATRRSTARRAKTPAEDALAQAAPLEARSAPIERVLADVRERRSAQADVASRVAVSIDLGLLEPNERLPRDDELATAFGVSAITVRRALRDLTAEGIVVRRPGRGGGTFVVAEPPRDALRDYEIERALVTRHVWDLLDYRKILELGIVQVATRIASADDVVELRRAVDAMAKAKDWAAFRPLDRGFHLALARSARSARALEELTAVLRRLAQLYFPYPLEYLRASNHDHRAIVDAISDGDATTAAEALDRHIEAAKDTFSWIARGPGRAPP